MRPAPRSPLPAAAVAAAVVLVVIGAALRGSWTLQPRNWELGGGGTRSMPPMPSMPPMAPATQSAPPVTSGRSIDLSWLIWVGLGLLLLALGAAVIYLVRRYRQTALDAAEPAEPHDLGVLAEPEPELPVLRRGAEAARLFLDGVGDPTDAIVAAWLALEEAAEASGVPRQPAQTPTEFTVAVIASTEADPAATAELLRLYHRARFSSTGARPADVTAAAACLARIAADWQPLATTTGPVEKQDP